MADSRTITVTLKTVADIKDVQSNIQQIQKGLSGLQLPKALSDQFAKTFSTLQKNAEKASSLLAGGFKDKSSVTAYERTTNAIVNDMQKLSQLMGRIDASKLNFETNAKEVENLLKQITDLQRRLGEIRTQNLEKVQKVLKSFKGEAPSTASAWKEFLDGFNSGDIQKAEKALSRLQKQVEAHKTALDGKEEQDAKWVAYANGVAVYENALKDLKGESEQTKDVVQELANATENLASAQQEAQAHGARYVGELSNKTSELARETKNWANNTQAGAEATGNLNSSLAQFKDKVTYFFGLSNAVQLFQRAIRSAFETVKELDEVMTQTAVVTTFDVGDMWNQLPEYTQRATELGVSIKEAYEAATLYYQQGLSTNEVMAVSNETLKMARIAGLDAADATDRMTNALRGFNMEITESNAQNINDVYSNLAAKTASNVDEISTAMTKVASLANNANMSFENTAAFLSQIIETTRESAETAGTALKTVIARFSEVKSLYSEGALLGTDTEGEEINVNKVSAALRTAGINLNEYLTGMKGLDEIFMELSEKWDTLDQVQQRYIATMAAGSRQQSRFIALMQDYGRMTELVGYANDAAGASQQQFNKTLDSLRTKLTQLQNEWNSFLMGIANSEIIKGTIELLTKLLSVINKVLSESQGVKKTVNTIGLTVAGGFLAKGVSNAIIGSLRKIFGVAGNEAKVSFAARFKDLGEIISKNLPKKPIEVDPSGISELSKAYDDFKKIQEEAARASHAATSPILEGTTEIISASNRAKAAAEGQAVAEEALNKILEGQGITLATYQKIKEANLSNEEAAIVVAKIRNGTLQEEDIITGKVTVSEAAYNETIKRGAADQIKSVGGTIASIAAKSKIPIVNRLAQISEEKLGNEATKTGIKMAISLGWITAIIAAVAALTAGVIFLVKAMNDDTPEKRMKELKESTEEANKVAKETADAYDELKNSISSLEDKHKALENLTRGTTEWRDAVRGINDEVAELIGKYPELSKFVDNKGGVLTIDFNSEGVQDILSTESQKVINAQAAAAGQKIYEADENLALKRRDAMNQIASRLGITDENTFDKMTEAFAKGDKLAGQANLGDNLDIEDVWKDSEVITVLQNFSNALSIAENTVAGFSMELSAVAASSEVFTEEEAGFVSGYLDTRIKDIQQNELGKLETQDLSKNGSYEAFFRELYGDEYVGIDTDGRVNLTEGKSIAPESAKNRYAASRAVEEGVVEVQQAMEKLGEEGIKYMSRFYAGELKALEYNDSTTQVKYGMNDDEKRLFQENQAKIESSSETLKNTGINEENINILKDMMTVEQYSKFSEDVAKFGEEGGQNYVNAFIGAVKSVSSDKQEGLASFIANTDWSNLSQYDSNLEALINTYGMSREAAIEFYNTAADSANAYIDSVEKALQLQSALKESFDKVGEAQERLAEGKGTQEDVNMLIAAGMDASAFELTADGWKASTEALKEYTKALREEKIVETKNAIQKNQDTFNEATEHGFFQDAQKQWRKNGNTSLKEEQVDWLVQLDYLTEEQKDDEEVVAKAVEEYLKYLNEDYEKTQQLLQAELDYERSQTYTAEENYASEGSDKSIIMSAQREADTLGIEQEDFKAYTELIQQVNDGLEEVEANMAALGSAKFTKGFKGLVDTHDDWSKVLKKNKLDTIEEIKVYEEFRKNVNLLVSAEEDLSDSFYRTIYTSGLLEEALNGNADALIRLQKLAAKEFVLGLEVPPSAEKEVQEFVDFLDSFELEPMEVGATLDNTDFINALNELITKTGIGADSVTELLSKINFIPQITYEEASVELSGPGVTNPEQAKIKVPVIKSLVSTGSRPGNLSTGAKGGGGGGGGSDKTEYWENPYDELYNLQEKINEALRTRERLERDYQKLLKSETATTAQIRKDYFAQVAAIREEIKLQEQLAAGRLKQIKNLENQLYTDDEGNRSSFASLGVTQYANYNEETGLIQIDWSGLEEIANDPDRVKEGEAVEAYISKLEELVSGFEDVRDAIWDMEDTIQEIADTAIESYMNFEERTYDAVINHYEKQIDAFESLSDTISDSTDKVLDGIQDQIEAERQMRENEKKEQEIADKEARLAYLSRDTSGANDLEIMQLQKDIETARQNYEDTLIDQALQQMRDDADLAAEQRAQQIETMREQLEIAQKNGDIWDLVYNLINNAVDENGTLSQNSDLVKLLEESEAYEALSAFGQDKWKADLVKEFNEAWSGLIAGGADKAGDHMNTGKTEPAITTTTTTTSNNGTTTTTTTTSKVASSNSGGGSGSGGGGGKSTTTGNGNDNKNSVASTNYAPVLSSASSESFEKRAAQEEEARRQEIIKQQAELARLLREEEEKLKKTIGGGAVVAGASKQTQHMYASGGLADYTGPAWLDGTRTKPEMVLNAQDTKNFISLRNILASLLNGQGGASFGGGDNYFNIDISAEIGSDYDVDQLADRIKRQIQDDSMYRNVNAISYIR